MQLENEKNFPREGVIDFVDNQVDVNTGTVQIRCVFANPTTIANPRAICPRTNSCQRRYQALLIPDAAVNSDQNERYLLVVGTNDVVQRRSVKLGALFGILRSITDGLNPDEWVIVNGMLSAMPGAKVDPARDSDPRRIAGRTGKHYGHGTAFASAARDAACHSARFAASHGMRAMKIAHFFIDRPVFAIVISIVTIIAGASRSSRCRSRSIRRSRRRRSPSPLLIRARTPKPCRNRRHADRRAGQRRGEHALHVQPVHQRPET